MIVFLRVGAVLIILVSSLLGGLALYQALEPALAPSTPSTPSVPTTQTLARATTLVMQAANKIEVAPLLAASATPTLSPTASTTSVASTTPEASPTVFVHPTAFPNVSVASFRAGDGGMRHNIEVAVHANGDALRHVVIAPGTTFSFNAALGPRPEGLPWRMVGRSAALPPAPFYDVRIAPMALLTATVQLDDSMFGQATAVPAPSPVPPVEASATPQSAPPVAETAVLPPVAAPPAAPTAVETPEVVFPPVLGGGVCDLASRFVVVGRSMLPPRAFRFKPHPGGLSGLRRSDAVSIWATNSKRYDNDLLITNTTNRWMIFEVYLDADQVSVAGWLQDGP